MGQKFASIHIQTHDTESVENAIFQSYARNPEKVEHKIRLLKAVFPDFTPEEIEHTRKLYALHDHAGEMMFCVKSAQYLSIYDGNLSFESVEEQVEEISKRIQAPVVYTSNFDDDLFLFGVMQNGRVITHGCVSDPDANVEECYGVKTCAANLRLFAETLGLSGEIPKMPKGDVDKAQAVMEKMLGIELDLSLPLSKQYRPQGMMQGIVLYQAEDR